MPEWTTKAPEEPGYYKYRAYSGANEVCHKVISATEFYTGREVMLVDLGWAMNPECYRLGGEWQRIKEPE